MDYQVPRGTQDILPKDISKWQKLEDMSIILLMKFMFCSHQVVKENLKVVP